MKNILKKLAAASLMSLFPPPLAQGMEMGMEEGLCKRITPAASQTTLMMQKISTGFSNTLSLYPVFQKEKGSIGIKDFIDVEQSTPLKPEIPNVFFPDLPPEIWTLILEKIGQSQKLDLRRTCQNFNGVILETFKRQPLIIPGKNLKKVSDLERILKAPYAQGITKLIFSDASQEKAQSIPLVKKENFFQNLRSNYFPFLFKPSPPEEKTSLSGDTNVSLVSILHRLGKSKLEEHPTITALDFSTLFSKGKTWISEKDYSVVANAYEAAAETETNILALIIANSQRSTINIKKGLPYLMSMDILRNINFLDLTNVIIPEENIKELIDSEETIPNLKTLILRYDNCPFVLRKILWEKCGLRKLDLTGRRITETAMIRLLLNMEKVSEVEIILAPFVPFWTTTPSEILKKKQDMVEYLPLLKWADDEKE